MSDAKHTPTLDIDPRGIRRKTTRIFIDPAGGSTRVEYECGHVGDHANHFAYRVGDIRFCYQCGKEARAVNFHNETVSALRRFGSHDDECPKKRDSLHECSCGYSAALKSAKEKS